MRSSTDIRCGIFRTGSLDCGLSRNAIRQSFVRDFVPMATASGIEARQACGESRTLHFDNALSRLNAVCALHSRSAHECSPCIALAQGAY